MLLMLVIRLHPRQHRDGVDLLDRHHRELRVLRQPAVKPLLPQGERADRDAVVKTFVRVGHRPRLDQVEVRLTKEFGVDPQVLAVGQQPADDHRDGAEAELDRRPVVHQRRDVGGDPAVDLGRLGRVVIGQGRVVLDDQAHVGDRHLVVAETLQPADPGHVRVDLDDDLGRGAWSAIPAGWRRAPSSRPETG